MTDHRATYATRFNVRAIRRPQPPPPPMTDEQFEEWVVTLDPVAQFMQRFGRGLRAGCAVAARARAES